MFYNTSATSDKFSSFVSFPGGVWRERSQQNEATNCAACRCCRWPHANRRTSSGPLRGEPWCDWCWWPHTPTTGHCQQRGHQNSLRLQSTDTTGIIYINLWRTTQKCLVTSFRVTNLVLNEEPTQKHYVIYRWLAVVLWCFPHRLVGSCTRAVRLQRTTCPLGVSWPSTEPPLTKRTWPMTLAAQPTLWPSLSPTLRRGPEASQCM